MSTYITGSVATAITGTVLTHEIGDSVTQYVATIASAHTTFINNDATMFNKLETITTGSYTPTISSENNLTGTINNNNFFVKVGNHVKVSGVFQSTITASGTKYLNIDLPYPPTNNFSTQHQAIGVHSTEVLGYVQSNAAAKTVNIGWTSGTTSGSVQMRFDFSYLIA
jgi:hypothetical protein